MRIQILLLIVGWMFAPAAPLNARDSIKGFCYIFSEKIKNPDFYPDLCAHLNELIERIPSLRNMADKKLQFESENCSLHITMLELAIREQFSSAKKTKNTNFNTPNIQRHYSVDKLNELYSSLKQALQKIHEKKFEPEVISFLDFFLNKPWYIMVYYKENFDQLVYKTNHIIKKILGEPSPEHKTENIQKLILNISRLEEANFGNLFLSVIQKFRFDQLCDLIEKKDDLAWEILSSTEHVEVLSSLDLIKNILYGIDIHDSVGKLYELFGRLFASSLLKSIIDKSVAQLVYGENKSRSIVCINNLFKATKKFKESQKMLIELIWELLETNPSPKIDLQQLITDLNEEGGQDCMSLAEKIEEKLQIR